MLVTTLMTTNPIAVQADETLAAALRAMFENDIRHLPVLSDERVVGMLSDRDVRGLLMPAVEAGGYVPEGHLDQPISAIMSGDPLTVGADAEVDDVIELMLEYKVGAVPVCDGRDGSLSGIISYTDILRAAQGKL